MVYPRVLWQILVNLLINDMGQSGPSESLQMIQNWEEGLIHQIFVLEFRGTSTCRRRGQEHHEAQQGKMPSPACGEELYTGEWGCVFTSTSQLECSCAENHLRVLVDNKLTMGQQCAFITRANSILGRTRKSIASRLRETILSFCSALVRPLCCWVQIWTQKYKKDELSRASQAWSILHVSKSLREMMLLNLDQRSFGRQAIEEQKRKYF